MFAQSRAPLAAPRAAEQWLPLASDTTYTATPPARLETRRRTLCALLSALPGSRYARLHFRLTCHAQQVPALLAPGETVTAYIHTLEVTDVMHRILSAIPGARIQPEVRPM